MKLVPLSVQVDSAEADLVMYRKALPEMVKEGKITKRYADAKIAVQESIVHTIRLMMPPPGVTQGTVPVVLHFATDKDRAEYLKASGLAK